MNLKEITEELKKPFARDDIEWRISRVFKSGKATVLPYLTSRAIMDRLDEVFGIDGWQDEYVFIENNVVCKLKVRFGDDWILKTDGAPQTDFESFKGGISDALKRAAVKFGIGRYLYNLDEFWVDILPNKPEGFDKKHIHYVNDKKTGIKGYWLSPELPKWALLPEVKEKNKTKNETMPPEEENEATPEKINPAFETFKDEMRKLYKEMGKEAFFAKLGWLGYEQVDDLKNESPQTLGKILKEMIQV